MNADTVVQDPNELQLTREGIEALGDHSLLPADMESTTSYAISGTDQDGYTRWVARNVVTRGHATTTINALAAQGWTTIILFRESF